ncbi:hypothetical protein COJ90_21270 [Priestia megaterium]|uniref:hypothetical protein n=1 Tax=Priestia megaterium TaxID=1404 RepID=UPI000BF51D23|nr:hypothetical protein [Priestia megaterium]PFP09246.1 hypothetical protein COJ90_21270 [Priestia megaterium]
MDEKEYWYYFLNLGKMYYAGGTESNYQGERLTKYEFVNNNTFAYPFLDKDIAQQIADECGGNLITVKGTFNEFIAQGQRWGKYIEQVRKK